MDTLAERTSKISFIKGWKDKKGLFKMDACVKNIKCGNNELELKIMHSKQGISEPYLVYMCIAIPGPKKSDSYATIGTRRGEPSFFTLEEAINCIEDFVTLVHMLKEI
jgi:hypothetical protein